MKLVIHPPVEPERLAKIVEAARPMTVVNARDEAEARRAIADADAFFGKLTPPLLAAARRLRWVQAPTASLEHYVFPELVDHPCVLTNMRGLFSDVIADHVFGYVLCFARNFHRYIRNQLEARWAPVGGQRSAVGLRHRARRRSAPSTAPTSTWRTPRSASSAWARSAPRSRGGRSRSGCGCSRSIRSRRRRRRAWRRSGGWTGCRDLLGASDFVVIAAPHTPETVKLFRRAQFRQMKPSGLPDQHRPRRDRRPRRSGRGAPRGRDRRGGAGRVRDGAAAGGPPALGDVERDPDAARGRVLAADRRAAPGRAPGRTSGGSRAASRSRTSSTRRRWF